MSAYDCCISITRIAARSYTPSRQQMVHEDRSANGMRIRKFTNRITGITMHKGIRLTRAEVSYQHAIIPSDFVGTTVFSTHLCMVNAMTKSKSETSLKNQSISCSVEESVLLKPL